MDVGEHYMYDTDSFYTRNRSLQTWRNRGPISTGALPQSDTQIFWFCPPGQAEPVDVHSVKEDALSALPTYIQQGYTLALAPFEFGGNKCAIIQDTTGRRICLLERVKPSQFIS